METQELEIFEIDGKQYLPMKAAIKYLHTPYERMQTLISFGVIPVTQIESRRLIELETLKAFAAKERLTRHGQGEFNGDRF